MYILVIIGLLHVQFSTDESFLRTIGALTVKGEKSRAAITGKRGLSSLSVDAFGFTFSFDDSDPVLIETKDGLTHKGYALDFTPYTDGLEIDLGKGISIRFLLEDEGLRIIPATSMIESIERMNFPVSLQPGITVRSGSGMPVLAVSDSLLGETHFAALQEGIRYDDEAGYFILESDSNGIRELTFRSAPPGIEDPLTFWFAGKTNFPDQAEYAAAVSDFLSNARRGWETSRFSRETGTWESGFGSNIFSEDIAVILLSEAVGTGRFPRVQEDMTIASADHKDELSKLSAPFLGDIVTGVTGFIRSENLNRRYAGLLEAARNRDVGIFTGEGPERTAGLFTDNRLREEALETIAEINIETAGVEACLGMIEFLLSEGEGTQRELLASIIDEGIVPALVILDEGVYLASGERDSVSITTSLRAGSLLLKVGKSTEKETYEALGRSLVTSSLALADEKGFLPEVVRNDGLSIQAEQGVLPPEGVYHLLTDNRYYPKELSLAEYFSDGSWIWTCSSSVSITRGRDMYSLELTYPRGETHYFALHGIPRFSRLRLLGIDWKGDPIFQYYYSGWYYDEQTSTLYVKLRHRSERERLEIYYEQPADEAAAEEES